MTFNYLLRHARANWFVSINNIMQNDISSPTYVGPSLPSCLLCYLCGELFRRPRILPCGHTFCSECLAKIKDEIVNSGQTSSSAMSSSYHQCATDNLNKTLSPERNTCPALTASQLYAVQFTNGKPPDIHGGDSGSAVDCFDLGADSCENFPHTSPPDSVILRNPSAPRGGRVLARSDTYTVNKRGVSKDRTPSRLSCTQVTGGSKRACSNCGHVTPPRKRSPVARSSSVKERSTKSQGPRWDNSPQRKSASAISPPACSFDQKHGKEMELFVCPMPDCSYSMRVMNLSRWSPRNRAIADAVAAWKRLQADHEDESTQTDISNNHSLLVTLPRTLVNDKAMQPLSARKRHSSMLDMAYDRAISMDGLQRGYLPRGHFSWRSYAAMVGMNILHQLVNL